MIGNKFKSINRDIEWVELEDERFVNWMMPNTYPSTYKGWFRIADDESAIQPGQYTFQVKNMLDRNLFKGKKYFGFEEYSSFGAKNMWVLLTFALMFVLSSTFACSFYVLITKEKNIMAMLAKDEAIDRTRSQSLLDSDS